VSDYKVQLEVYSGPLDLLLYLIRRDEVDIYDIPIARVTAQYVNYCETLSLLDPNLAGEFLVLAATLMEIKSRLLLPTPPPDTEGLPDPTDPRSDLVRQLLEYKRFKDASVAMSGQAEMQSMRWPRGAPDQPPREPGEIDLEDVQIWDLVAAFNQLLSATGRGPATHDVVFDDTPISLHAADIVDRLVREGNLNFEQVFAGRTRAETIGLFLALLELIRQARIRATQTGAFGPIRLDLLSADPIEISDSYEYRERESDLGDENAADDPRAHEEAAPNTDSLFGGAPGTAAGEVAPSAAPTADAIEDPGSTPLRLVEPEDDEMDEVMQAIARISTEPRDPSLAAPKHRRRSEKAASPSANDNTESSAPPPAVAPAQQTSDSAGD